MITPIGNFISAALGTLTAAAGAGISALAGARAAKKRNRILGERERMVNSVAEQMGNESGLEDSGSQAAMAENRAQNRAAEATDRGVGAVMGASAGSGVVNKILRNRQNAQLMSNLAANDSANRRDWRRWQMQELGDIGKMRLGTADNEAQQNAFAGSQLSYLGAGIAKGGWFDPKGKKNSET